MGPRLAEELETTDPPTEGDLTILRDLKARTAGITEEDLKEEHGRLPYNLSVVRGASGSGARKPKPKMRGEA